MNRRSYILLDEGDINTALAKPNSAVITEKYAKMYYFHNYS